MNKTTKIVTYSCGHTNEIRTIDIPGMPVKIDQSGLCPDCLATFVADMRPTAIQKFEISKDGIGTLTITAKIEHTYAGDFGIMIIRCNGKLIFSTHRLSDWRLEDAENETKSFPFAKALRFSGENLKRLESFIDSAKNAEPTEEMNPETMTTEEFRAVNHLEKANEYHFDIMTSNGHTVAIDSSSIAIARAYVEMAYGCDVLEITARHNLNGHNVPQWFIAGEENPESKE